jgi:transposase
VNTSLALLDKYPSPDAVLNAKKSSITGLIRKTSRFGTAYAEEKYEMLISAAKKAKSFGHSLPSHTELIRLYISMIRTFDSAAKQLIRSVKDIVESYPDELFCRQIKLLETIKGCGFLSAVTLMCEIGNFSVFSAPKKLYAYLGLDPSVKQSGKFNGTNVKLSKRGSSLARRVLHMMAINSIGLTKNGKSKNPILRDFYDKKCLSKPKMIALSAVMHKLCNIIFAVLRDNKPFEFISPEQHNLVYRNVS